MIRNTLRDWHATHDDRTKLQHAYIAFAVVSIVAAGLIGLVNYDLGQQLTALALLSLAIFFVNLLAWTLLQGLVLMNLDKSEQSAAVSAQKKQSPKTTSRTQKN